MKATINNIQIEGTPAEFAEFVRLQTPIVECTEEPKIEIPNIVKPTHKKRKDIGKYSSDTGNKYSVLYQETPIGTMTSGELCALFDKSREAIRRWFISNNTIEYNGYKVTIISRGKPRGSFKKLKITDTKGNNRIFQSISAFCQFSHISRERYRYWRKKQPQGPLKIDGYIVEEID